MEVSIKKEIHKDISKEDFMAYEDCRLEGLTNMFHLSNVELITGLSRDKIIAIMDNYEQLSQEFLKE